MVKRWGKSSPPRVVRPGAVQTSRGASSCRWYTPLVVTPSGGMRQINDYLPLINYVREQNPAYRLSCWFYMKTPLLSESGVLFYRPLALALVMNSLNLIAGIFFALLGMLVKIFPNLIAGFNNLSIPEKKSIDEKTLVSFVQLILFGLGIANILFFLIIGIMDWPDSYGTTFFKYTSIGIVLCAVLYLNIKKPHHKK